MNKHLLLILSFVFLAGCGSPEYKPKYKDFKNSRERENLAGKVKTLEQYKANVIDYKTGETEKPVIEFKEEFTKDGYILYQAYFDHFGKIEQNVKNKFDNKGYLQRSVSENFITNSRSVQTFKCDTLTGKPVYSHSVFDDSTDFETYSRYDKNGNITEQTNIQNGDTTTNRIEYKYDGKGNILSKRVIQNSEDGKNVYLTEYKYDQNGNQTELINKSDFYGEMKTTYEYDNDNRVKKITQFDDGQIEQETFFDKFYNQTLVKYYNNGLLERELKYEYEFDNRGNWIERKAFMKEYAGQNKNWKPVYIETRKIEYFD